MGEVGQEVLGVLWVCFHEYRDQRSVALYPGYNVGDGLLAAAEKFLDARVPL